MNKEDYVSLEVAQILKDKDIFIPNYLYIVTEDVDKDPYGNSYKKGDLSHYGFKVDNRIATIKAPHLYDVQKWLRNEYKIHIEIMHMYIETEKTHINYYLGLIKKLDETKTRDYSEECSTFEKALNDSIKVALKYI